MCTDKARRLIGWAPGSLDSAVQSACGFYLAAIASGLSEARKVSVSPHKHFIVLARLLTDALSDLLARQRSCSLTDLLASLTLFLTCMQSLTRCHALVLLTHLLTRSLTCTSGHGLSRPLAR